MKEKENRGVGMFSIHARTSRDLIETAIDTSKDDRLSSWEEIVRSGAYRGVQRWDSNESEAVPPAVKEAD